MRDPELFFSFETNQTVAASPKKKKEKDGAQMEPKEQCAYFHRHNGIACGTK